MDLILSGGIFTWFTLLDPLPTPSQSPCQINPYSKIRPSSYICRNLFNLKISFLTPLNMIVAPRHLFAFGSPEVEAKHLSRLPPNC